MNFLDNLWGKILDLSGSLLNFLLDHIRAIIIIAIIIAAIVSVIAFHDGAECVTADFGASCDGCTCNTGTEGVCALFGSNLKGISVNNEYLEFEWYPLFFGINYNHYKVYNNCASPVICGVDILALSCVDTSLDYYMPDSTDLPITTKTYTGVEGEDYIITNLVYTLSDNEGSSFSSDDPNELFNSPLFKQISAGYIESFLNFYISVSFDVEATSELELTTKVWVHYAYDRFTNESKIVTVSPDKATRVSFNIPISGMYAKYDNMSVVMKSEAKVEKYTLGEDE